MDYQILKTVPEEMQSTFEMYKKSRGYLFDEEQKVLIVFMGERSTGGYSIMLREIEAEGGVFRVITNEKSPGPNDIVTQAFTWPALILQLEESFQEFEIRDSDGQPYEPVTSAQS